MNVTTGPGPARHAELTRTLLRERVLDVVAQLLRDRPWTQVTMAEVAAHAGVSRQTLYNAFGSRRDLARACLSREADQFLAAVDAAVREHVDEPRHALQAALRVFLTAARDHPLVQAITSADGSEELLSLVTTRGDPLITHVTEHLSELLVETWPRLRQADSPPIVDALVRLAISYAALPSGDPAATASAIAEILGPRVDELLG